MAGSDERRQSVVRIADNRISPKRDGATGVLGIATIVQLVRKQPSGILLAKTFLGFVIVMLVLEVAQLKTGQQSSRFTGSFIVASLWFAYLSRSERVKNTFGAT